MTYHLPECHYTVDTGNIQYGWNECICDALRACEQRVRRSLWQECYDAAMQTTKRNYDWHEKRGYAAALDAAEAAVADCPSERPSMRGMLISVNDALAAIHALKEKR